MLFSFGIAMLVCGFVYRTPIPVQRMKAAGAIATTQAAQTLHAHPGNGSRREPGHGSYLAGDGPDRHRSRVASLVKRPVVVGIVLCLGFGFMIEGAKMMSQELVDRQCGVLGVEGYHTAVGR